MSDKGDNLYKSIPGWFREETAASLDRLIKEHEVSQVLEIGTYLGKSAVFFLARVLEVLCVDPFVMWEEGSRNGDAVRDGGDDFYQKFKDNVEHARSFGPNLTTLRVLRTTSGYAFLENPELKADLIYIDGAHDYKSVKQDITTWGTRARKIICGDDYDENWPGVMQAVDEIFPDRIVEGNFWYKII